MAAPTLAVIPITPLLRYAPVDRFIRRFGERPVGGWMDDQGISKQLTLLSPGLAPRKTLALI